jgi:oligoendopeptidase F
MTTIPARNEIPEEAKWNAPSVFADKAAWEAACDQLPAKLEKVTKFTGRVNEGPSVLVECLETVEDAIRLGSKILFYAFMTAACDSTDTEAAAMSDRSQGLFGQTMAAVSFVNPELIAMGEDTLDQWLQEEPRLSYLKQFSDNLFRQQKHIRSAEVEQVLGLASDPFRAVENIFDILTSADMKFAPAKGSDGTEYDVAQGTVDTLYGNNDREIRRTAFESYTGLHLDLKNTIAATYLASVKRDVFNVRVRGYDSSIEASLFGENVPLEVHDSLIETYKENIPTWHRYWDVRRRMLGVDELQPYDIWAPLSKKMDEIPYEQSVEWIYEGLKPLGDDYVNALRKGCLEDRWVDIYPNKGKRQGAFSWGTYDTYPFLMLSYDGSLTGMSTLAHELGHSMHSYLTIKNQPYVYTDYSLFVAEVASNFNQAMTRAYLKEAKKDDVNFQIALIEEAMDNFHRYFFIMPTLARFELEVHNRAEKGIGMTADDLNELCCELFSEGYGDKMHVDKDRVGITWATFGHLYSNFYVYQYATGISAANMLAKKILAGNQTDVQHYLEFLSAGSSMYPLDALNHAGIDMTKPDAVETTFAVLSEMVDRLEELAGV